MSAKHTPGPLKAVMRSTYSAAWPSIVQVCIDQNGDEWERDLGDCETSHLAKKDARNSREFHGDYNETPHLFEIDPLDGEEMVANAVLWAAAPELLMALRLALPALEYLRKQFPRSEHDDSIDVLAVSKAAIAKATGEPQ